MVVLLLAAAWFGSTRIAVAPSILAPDPRILGTYLVPIDDAFELAAEMRLEGGAAGEDGARLRAERSRFRHVLFGYGEIAHLEGGQWVVYVPTKLNPSTIREPLAAFLDATGILRAAGDAAGPAAPVGEYHLLPDGVLICSPGTNPLPQRTRVTAGPNRRVLMGLGRDWRYVTTKGCFPHELDLVAAALKDPELQATSETLVLWRHFQPSSVNDSPPAPEVFSGHGSLLAEPAGPPTRIVKGAIPLFPPRTPPDPMQDNR